MQKGITVCLNHGCKVKHRCRLYHNCTCSKLPIGQSWAVFYPENSIEVSENKNLCCPELTEDEVRIIIDNPIHI